MNEATCRPQHLFRFGFDCGSVDIFTKPVEFDSSRDLVHGKFDWFIMEVHVICVKDRLIAPARVRDPVCAGPNGRISQTELLVELYLQLPNLSAIKN